MPAETSEAQHWTVRMFEGAPDVKRTIAIVDHDSGKLGNSRWELNFSDEILPLLHRVRHTAPFAPDKILGAY